MNRSVLAFYFPQFHEFEENNQLWGKGFTDHSNLIKVQTSTARRLIGQLSEMAWGCGFTISSEKATAGSRG